jgi:hypothetical protein
LITRIYRESENINSQKTNDPMKEKNGKRTEESFSKGRRPNG